MAKYQATVSFSGPKLSMSNGEVREFSDPAIIDGLLKVGYLIELVETHQKSVSIEKKSEEPKEEKPKSRGKGKKS